MQYGLLRKARKRKKSEDFIRKLGYDGFRVRHHGIIARIELRKSDIPVFVQNHGEITAKKLKEHNFSHVCVDLNGIER